MSFFPPDLIVLFILLHLYLRVDKKKKHYHDHVFSNTVTLFEINLPVLTTLGSFLADPQ